MSKITKATFKSFIRKNKGNLWIKLTSDFNGMTDAVESVNSAYTPLHETEKFCKNTLGFNGVWLVGGSRNSFSEYESDGYKGIYCYNCCRSFAVVIPA